MFLFLQLKVLLNLLSNIYQTEFDQSPTQACAIDLSELNYGSDRTTSMSATLNAQFNM